MEHIDTSKVTRFEVIDHSGVGMENHCRVLVVWDERVKFDAVIQDEGRTLKVFIGNKEVTSE
jgi:hypothetical protein